MELRNSFRQSWPCSSESDFDQSASQTANSLLFVLCWQVQTEQAKATNFWLEKIAPGLRLKLLMKQNRSCREMSPNAADCRTRTGEIWVVQSRASCSTCWPDSNRIRRPQLVISPPGGHAHRPVKQSRENNHLIGVSRFQVQFWIFWSGDVRSSSHKVQHCARASQLL